MYLTLSCSRFLTASLTCRLCFLPCFAWQQRKCGPGAVRIHLGLTESVNTASKKSDQHILPSQLLCLTQKVLMQILQRAKAVTFLQMPIKSVRVIVNLKPIGLSTPFELSLTHTGCFLIQSNSWIRAGKSPMHETARGGGKGRAAQGHHCAPIAVFNATSFTKVS